MKEYDIAIVRAGWRICLRGGLLVDMFGRILNLIRMKEWIHIVGLSILGFTYFSGANIPIISFIFSILISSLILGFAYSYNIISDFKSGGENYVILSYLLLISSLLIALIISIQIFALTSLALLTAFIYSSPDFNLKSKPFICTLLNAAGFSILFFIGNYTAANKSDFIIGFLIFCAVIPFQLVHELQDIKEDRRNKITTTAVRLGKEKTRKLVYVSLFVLLFWSVVLYYLGYTIYITLTTFIFTALAAIVLYTKKNIRKIHFRYLASIYGLMLLLIFLMK